MNKKRGMILISNLNTIPSGNLHHYIYMCVHYFSYRNKIAQSKDQVSKVGFNT